MRLLTPLEDLPNIKANQNLKFKCCACSKEFLRPSKQYTEVLSGKRPPIRFCSCRCSINQTNLERGRLPAQEVACSHCGVKFHKKFNQIKKTNNHFCSHSCSAKYNNTNKKHGTRRSKLEVWLEKELTKLYPDLEFSFNETSAINAELDIYIPTLKLAFELNGIFHYEPIFGADKLLKTQTNDERKFQACLEAGIELCILDTSGQKYFKPQSSKKYLDIIIKIIDSKWPSRG